jgi:[NiFe] hydrogenase diaphorase moiety small subunit
MSRRSEVKRFTFVLDGRDVEAREGQTILEAADGAGVYIPRLCHHKDLPPAGHCRLCSVKVNGKVSNACTAPAAEWMVVESNTEELNEHRRRIIELLFVEGNHFCPFCEKSGNCELQALAYRFGMTAPVWPYLSKNPAVDASHPDVFIDRNRCVLCGRCVRASRERDHKSVFGFEGRGIGMRIALDSLDGLGASTMAREDAAADICPTGALVVKRVGYRTPYGARAYDKAPIGSQIEKKEE